jgi:hypothetical protein
MRDEPKQASANRAMLQPPRHGLTLFRSVIA